MSNLGRYQEIVTDAALEGGVEQWLKKIEQSAVADATPKIVAGTLLAAGALYVAGNRGHSIYLQRKAVRQATSDRAKVYLKAKIVEASTPETDQGEEEAAVTAELDQDEIRGTDPDETHE